MRKWLQRLWRRPAPSVPLRPYAAEKLPAERMEHAWQGRADDDFTRAVMEVVEFHWYEAYRDALGKDPRSGAEVMEGLMREMRERLRR